jgi:arabinofuranosyltransferase
VLATALLLAVGGWKLFWFQTDDAYITFRYVSNLMDGYGLVWNPAPFRPVEGYTSFAWALALAAVWRLTGQPPPRTAGALSLLCGLATLVLVWRAAGRLRLAPVLERRRTLLTAVALLGICTNPTFLTWLSSGLETQLFNLALTWWLLEAMGLLGKPGAAARFRLATASALAALARPDGLLTVPATLALELAWTPAERRPRAAFRAALGSSSPLLAVAGHLVWRRAFYGEWLPNTYYAKVPAPWPEMGWRYLASFVVENGLWLWLGLAVAAACRRLLARRSRRPGSRGAESPAAVAGGPPPEPAQGAEWPAPGPLGRGLAAAVVLAHLAYYTLIVGGDHFEYRVFSYLVPLLFLAALALVDALALGAVASVTALVLLLLASWPLPWLQWWRTKDLVSRKSTHFLHVELGPEMPPLLRPPVAAWDAWQAELTRHAICARRVEHRVFFAYRSARLPSREEGAKIPWSGRPVIADLSVGILGWVLPHVAVIDTLGLNDRVVARTPLTAGAAGRGMIAHERHPPAGYVDCFMPNVDRVGAGVQLTPRPAPLTDERIRACESRDWTSGSAAAPPR